MAANQTRILRVLERFVGPNDAQDVMQEAFIRAFKARASFRGHSSFYTWMYRIAINTAKNFVRTRKEHASLDEMANVGEEQASEGASPEEEAIASEMEDRAAESIRALSSNLQDALVLRDIEGLTYKEIADIVGTPLGTVRSRISRARNEVRTHLKEVHL